MGDELEDWKRYERLVARLMADQLSTEFCVTPNASVLGRITGIPRQIDVLIEARHDTDNSRRIIVDAKRRKRKIDVKEVESFRGMMEDVGATHGYLVCPNGHTAAAEKRAQSAVSIRLLPLDRLESFDPRTWPRCVRLGCKYGRVFWDGYPEISLGLVAPDGTPTRMTFVHSVGKCDRCRKFHVSCATCRQILYVPEDDDSDIGHQCACRLPWFWLASIEEDERGARSAELHLAIGVSEVRTVNRRSLSTA
ncbi:restriction endonuclease [Aminobacter ciceronei]|uniref:Restriction endonuclease type IV Mrr domain-containing protein n=1 Tax=Aminobacter ciceronei TaxID=150723 RepID=A0ABR6CCD0_9HYPH|nr:restriction endonuclease [Aminobacter ciceronei]MBA8908834.1 hypothetical protein [Aminobacter ciceronei]MBA9022687.1 hypothetical protein [Aminobacter ciceronei]